MLPILTKIADRINLFFTPRDGKPGGWMNKESENIVVSQLLQSQLPDIQEDLKKLENPKSSAWDDVMTKVRAGEAEVDEAILFMGRFDANGRLLRESKIDKGYKLVRVFGTKQFNEAATKETNAFTKLKTRIKESQAKEDWGGGFTSNSDLGSTYTLDPNQFTEFVPFFNGPFSKQQYFDYFKGHAYAFQQWNHAPIAHRIIDILTQYTLGRGLKVRCKDPEKDDAWTKFEKENEIIYKMRKFWYREYLIYGENFIDNIRWVSVDPSTIYDIICEGYGEYIDKVLYYQQMFQTRIQEWAGIQVPGVAGSKQTQLGKYIIRQIPYDQIIHIKTNVVSIEARGRSVLFSVLGWIKKLGDVIQSRALGEQLRAAFVWDDEVDGTQAQVSAHAQRYQYIPVAPSIFVHNKSIKRTALQPMANINGSGAQDVVNEIICYIATAVGISKDQFNVLTSGSGSRATAIVGSEPFTKVIEDGQEDVSYLFNKIIEKFCDDNDFEYDRQEWLITFPNVAKDSTKDVLANIALCETMGWIAKPRAASEAASEMGWEDYNYDDEMLTMTKDTQTRMNMSGTMPQLPPLPMPPVGAPATNGTPSNDLHDNKQNVIDQHKTL